MIEPMKPKQTFQQAEIQDGDIICFQKVYNEKEYVKLLGFHEFACISILTIGLGNFHSCRKALCSTQRTSMTTW